MICDECGGYAWRLQNVDGRLLCTRCEIAQIEDRKASEKIREAALKRKKEQKEGS